MNNLLQKWKTRYYNHDDATIADTLHEAKAQKLRHYRNICSRHGEMVFYTKDNSCPICAAEARNRRILNDREFNRARSVYNEIKRRALMNGVVFELNLNEFRQMYLTNVVCPILGMPLEIGNIQHSDYSPSVDRLDPGVGYVHENIAMISNRANRLKNNGTAKEHMQIALWMMRQNGISKRDIQSAFSCLLDDNESV